MSNRSGLLLEVPVAADLVLAFRRLFLAVNFAGLSCPLGRPGPEWWGVEGGLKWELTWRDREAWLPNLSLQAATMQGKGLPGMWLVTWWLSHVREEETAPKTLQPDQRQATALETCTA